MKLPPINNPLKNRILPSIDNPYKAKQIKNINHKIGKRIIEPIRIDRNKYY